MSARCRAAVARRRRSRSSWPWPPRERRPGPDFPPGFLWGTAISAFQTEAGGTGERRQEQRLVGLEPRPGRDRRRPRERRPGARPGPLGALAPGPAARTRAARRECLPLLDRVEPPVPALDRRRPNAEAARPARERARRAPLRGRAARDAPARAEAGADAQPLHAAELAARSARDPRRLRRPRARRSPALARARRLARPHHGPRVRRVRRLGSPPLRQARGHLGHRQRADGRGRERLRERARGVRGLFPPECSRSAR